MEAKAIELLHYIPSIPYPVVQQHLGRWHPVTSTLNWCEEDYYMTYWVAEFVNTFTNLLFIYLGIKGVRNCVKNKHDKIFLISFLGYLAVGTGSFFFHSTLLYPMQLVDELSMIYTTCIMCYACFSFSRSRNFRIWLATFLVALSAGITAYYHYLQDPSFHQNAYALLTAIVVFRSIYVMEVNIRPSLRGKYTRKTLPDCSVVESIFPKSYREDERDKQILRSMWLMIGLGLTIFLGGFIVWTLDNEFCRQIRGWRHQIGLPWGMLLEGHGWWHLMTGVGAYLCLVWAIWLRHCLNERQDEYKLNWPSWYSLPEIVSHNGGVENGISATNGHLKTN